MTGVETILSCAYSPDGKYLAASGSGGKQTVRVYSMTDGKEVSAFGKSNTVGNMVVFSPGSRRVAVCYTTYGDAFEVTLLEEFVLP